MSIVRDNLIEDIKYRPYCGNLDCKTMPRTVRTNDLQFLCTSCGWKSSFDEKFIKEYAEKHNLKRR